MFKTGTLSHKTKVLNKGTLLFIKTKERIRMHLKESQESERSARRRREDKGDGKMGPVVENQWRRPYVDYFYFIFHLYIFFICLKL